MLLEIAVIGMGKIGLPLSAQFASKGHKVVGVDVNPATVETINAAKEPFPGEFGLAEALKSHVSSGMLRATTAYEDAIPGADVVVVAVPLFVDEDDQPDFGWMDSATTSISTTLTRDTLIIYETTLPIGTTRNRWRPMLEELSGLTEGSDFHVVFSPERVLTGRVFEDLQKYPKLIGGLTTKGASLAIDFYHAVIDFRERNDLAKPNGVWDLGSAEAAEMAKLAETTYRDVNIALANQFALHAEKVGVDVYQVIESCNSQPYSHIHQPGISVGGHCIPVYPHLYLSTDPGARMVQKAREFNKEAPARAIQRIEEEFGGLNGVQVLILGVSYRAGVKEDAYSGVYELVRLLRQKNSIPFVSDPGYSADELEALKLPLFRGTQRPEVIIVHTAHPDYRTLSSKDFPSARLIYDGRSFLDRKKWRQVRLISIGRGAPADDSTR